MFPTTIEGLPVYVNPLIGEKTILRCLKDTPQEYLIVDSLKTLEDALAELPQC